MVLVTIIAVSSSSDGEAPPLPPKADAILRSGAPFLPIQFVVKASSIDDAPDEGTWRLGFEQDLVAALNDETQGLDSLISDEDNSRWSTELVVHEDQVAVGS